MPNPDRPVPPRTATQRTGRRARQHRLRVRVVSLAVGLFLAAWGVIGFQLATGSTSLATTRQAAITTTSGSTGSTSTGSTSTGSTSTGSTSTGSTSTGTSSTPTAVTTSQS